MSYANTGLSLIAGGVAGGPKIFGYTSTDVHTDVDASGYFSDGKKFGMAVGDFVLVAKSDATIGATLHVVQSISGDAVTISPAILA